MICWGNSRTAQQRRLPRDMHHSCRQLQSCQIPDILPDMADFCLYKNQTFVGTRIRQYNMLCLNMCYGYDARVHTLQPARRCNSCTSSASFTRLCSWSSMTWLCTSGGIPSLYPRPAPSPSPSTRWFSTHSCLIVASRRRHNLLLSGLGAHRSNKTALPR
jgi:hypothetical protein